MTVTLACVSNVPSPHSPCTSSALRLLIRMWEEGLGWSQTGHHHGLGLAFTPVTVHLGSRPPAPPCPVSMHGRSWVHVCKDFGLQRKDRCSEGWAQLGLGLPPEPSSLGERRPGLPLAPGPKQVGGRFRPQPPCEMKLLRCREVSGVPRHSPPQESGSRSSHLLTGI